MNDLSAIVLRCIIFILILIACIVAAVRAAVRQRRILAKLTNVVDDAHRLAESGNSGAAFERAVTILQIPCSVQKTTVGFGSMQVSGVIGDAGLKLTAKTLSVQAKAAGVLLVLYRRSSNAEGVRLAEAIATMLRSQQYILGSGRLMSRVTGQYDQALVNSFAQSERCKGQILRAMPTM